MIVEAEQIPGQTVKRLFDKERTGKIEVMQATVQDAPLSQSVSVEDVNTELTYDVMLWLDVELERIIDLLPEA